MLPRRVHGHDVPKLAPSQSRSLAPAAHAPANQLLALLPAVVRARLEPHLEPVNLQRKDVGY
jgi:hypothetical protein